MTYSHIFKNVYYDNKKLLRIYLTICVVASVFFFGTTEVLFATEDFTTSEVVATLGGNFGVLFAPFMQSFLAAIDTPSALLLLSGASVALDLIPVETLDSVGNFIGAENLESLSYYSFGLLDSNIFRILCVVWFIVSKLARSNRVTYSTGLVLEDIENKIGAFVNIVVALSQFLANLPAVTTVQAASEGSQATSSPSPVLTAFLCIIFLIGILAVYFFVRWLFYFIDIILIPICSLVPFSATALETGKTVLIAVMMAISVLQPYIFVFIAIVTLIISIVLFKKIYVTVRYFKRIYVRPFFKRFVGYDTEIPLVSPQVPKKVTEALQNVPADIVIPVYLINRILGHKYTHRHDCWWYVHTQTAQVLLKPRLFKKGCYCIPLTDTSGQKMFIKKSLRFFEIFNLLGTEENIGKPLHKVRKKIHFVFSKEYLHRYETMKQLTGYIDYTKYKNQIKENIKLTKAEAKEQKRMARLEAKEAKHIASYTRE